MARRPSKGGITRTSPRRLGDGVAGADEGEPDELTVGRGPAGLLSVSVHPLTTRTPAARATPYRDMTRG
jgi:hypothetical protein